MAAPGNFHPWDKFCGLLRPLRTTGQRPLVGSIVGHVGGHGGTAGQNALGNPSFMRPPSCAWRASPGREYRGWWGRGRGGGGGDSPVGLGRAERFSSTSAPTRSIVSQTGTDCFVPEPNAVRTWLETVGGATEIRGPFEVGGWGKIRLRWSTVACCSNLHRIHEPARTFGRADTHIQK